MSTLSIDSFMSNVDRVFNVSILEICFDLLAEFGGIGES
jgi:hypothetical protein